MKIEQQQKFQPITITLETAEEADAFLSMVDDCSDSQNVNLAVRSLAQSLANWLSLNL